MRGVNHFRPRCRLRSVQVRVDATPPGDTTTTRSVTFTTETSIVDLRRLVKRFADDGAVRTKVEKRLLTHLSKAARFIKQDRDGKAVEDLKAFKREAKEARPSVISVWTMSC